MQAALIHRANKASFPKQVQQNSHIDFAGQHLFRSAFLRLQAVRKLSDRWPAPRWHRHFTKIGIGIAFLGILFGMAWPTGAQQLTLEDIFLKRLYRAAVPEGFVPLRDGQHYILQREDAAGQLLWVKADVASGSIRDTLLGSNWLIPPASSEPIRPDHFELGPNENLWLFTTATKPVYRYSRTAVCWVYDLARHRLIPIADGKPVQEPSFSPDGRFLSYVLDNNIFLTRIDDGVQRQITWDGQRNRIINGISDWVYEEEFSFTRAYQWSPDSRFLAWYRFDEQMVPEMTIQYFRDQYPENYTYRYPKVGERNATVTLHITNVELGTTVQVATGGDASHYIPRIKWTDDGRWLCVFRMNRWQNQLELLLADAQTGATRTLLMETDARYIDIHDHLQFFSKSRFFLWTSERSGFNHIYIGEVSTGRLRPLTTGNWEVTECYGLDEQRGIVYFQSTEISPLERHVFSVAVRSGKKVRLTNDRGWNSAQFDPTFSYFLLTHSTAETPNVYRLCDRQGKVLRTLEENNALKARLAALPLSRKEFFTFHTADGTLLHGWLLKPWHFDATKRYPVFMTGYGGPGSQLVRDGGGVNMFHQYLAQQGYVVACVDNRGTGGRGAEFKKCTYLKLGYWEPKDQIEGAHFLSTLPFVDASRICFFGWSYGGYLALRCLQMGADVIRAAVSVAPVTDWRFYDTIYTERYMRDQRENAEGYTASSVLTHVDSIRGHLLLVHGLADDNVHYQHSAVLMKMLYEKNIDFDQLTFPDKNHSLSGGNTSFYLYRKITEWLQRIMMHQ